LQFARAISFVPEKVPRACYIEMAAKLSNQCNKLKNFTRINSFTEADASKRRKLNATHEQVDKTITKSMSGRKTLKESVIVYNLDSDDDEDIVSSLVPSFQSSAIETKQNSTIPSSTNAKQAQIIDLDSPDPPQRHMDAWDPIDDHSSMSLPSPSMLIQRLSQSRTNSALNQSSQKSVSDAPTSAMPKTGSYQQLHSTALPARPLAPKPSPKRKKTQQEKDLENQRKVVEKEYRQREAARVKEAEQANRRANRVWNKADSAKQMVVDIDLSLFQLTGFGASIDALRDEGCRVELAKLALDGIILWRRVTQYVPHETEDRFVDLGTPRVFDEPHVLIKFSADDLAKEIMENTLRTRTLPTLRQKCPDRDVIVLVMGLQDYFRRKNLGISAQFKDNVLQTLDPSQKSSKSRGNQVAVAMAGLPDRTRMDLELMHLHIVERCKIIEIEHMNDLTDWLISLTTEIGLVPYKYVKRSLNLIGLGD
jgi:hypothetical protein